VGERKDSGSKPARAVRTLLKSQGFQNPLLLDTSWLHVGHVDEFVQFLPADNTMAAKRIKANLEVLNRETGATDAEVVRVPALYTRGTGTRSGATVTGTRTTSARARCTAARTRCGTSRLPGGGARRL